MDGSDFLKPDDVNLSKSSLGGQEDFPEPEEVLAKPNVMEVVTKLIKNGGLSKFISAGKYPASMNEPFSEHHRRAQMAEFFYLLDKAASEPKESEMRILYVTAFMIASWSEARTHQMSFKPFKPLLQETFELVCPERGFKFLAEEVYQDVETGKFISVWKAWGKNWGANFQTDPAIKFSFSSSGPCLNYNANFVAEINFSDGDLYHCSLPPGIVSHLTSSPQVWTFNGDVLVEHVSSRLVCKADLTEPGFLSREGKHRVKGYLYKDGKRQEWPRIHGSWDQKLIVSWEKPEKRETEIWNTPTEARNRFGFNSFASQLNYLSSELSEILPPTDSRLRKDIRLVGQGQFSEAEDAKQKLADWQSISEKSDAAKQSIWFEPLQESGPSKLKYRYKGGYWDCRAKKMNGDKRAWMNCPNIFGLE